MAAAMKSLPAWYRRLVDVMVLFLLRMCNIPSNSKSVDSLAADFHGCFIQPSNKSKSDPGTFTSPSPEHVPNSSWSVVTSLTNLSILQPRRFSLWGICCASTWGCRRPLAYARKCMKSVCLPSSTLNSDLILWFWNIVILWYCGVVVLWCCGVVVLWYCGVVVFW